MNYRIREHVESLFQGAPRSTRAIELKEEFISNLNDRYVDLIQQGESEENAYALVIAGIGDIQELINGLHEHEMFSPVNIQMQRQRSALFISMSVGIYIISLIFPFIFEEVFNLRNGMAIGSILMLICWAGATALLVFNAMSKPKYVKVEETIIEDFKEWKSESVKKNSLYKTIQGMIWTITVPLYCIIGVAFDAWHPGWLIFLLAPALNQVVRLIFLYREEK